MFWVILRAPSWCERNKWFEVCVDKFLAKDVFWRTICVVCFWNPPISAQLLVLCDVLLVARLCIVWRIRTSSSRREFSVVGGGGGGGRIRAAEKLSHKMTQGIPHHQKTNILLVCVCVCAPFGPHCVVCTVVVACGILGREDHFSAFNPKLNLLCNLDFSWSKCLVE